MVKRDILYILIIIVLGSLLAFERVKKFNPIPDVNIDILDLQEEVLPKMGQ